MPTSVVLPVKRFASAKRRLASVLSPGQRRELMSAMLGDVLAALNAARGLHELIVVTSEACAAAASAAAGARVIGDPLELGHSQAARLGVAAAEQAGAERVLLVPGDCPLLSAVDVENLLSLPTAAAPRMVIVSDRAGHGTNALMLEPPGAIVPAFGPGSFARHTAAAESAGVHVQAHDVAALALDVDTPADLAALRDVAEGHDELARRTAAVLRGVAPAVPASR